MSIVDVYIYVCIYLFTISIHISTISVHISIYQFLPPASFPARPEVSMSPC